MSSVASSDVHKGHGQQLDENIFLPTTSEQLKQLKDEVEELKSLTLPNQVSSQSLQISSSCWSTPEGKRVLPEISSIKLSPSSLQKWTTNDLQLSETSLATSSCFNQSEKHFTATSQHLCGVLPRKHEIVSRGKVDGDPLVGLSKSQGLLSRSDTSINVSTQDFSSSKRPSHGSFVFGLPSLVSNSFQFTPSSSLLSSMPLSVDSIQQSIQFSSNTTLSLGSQVVSIATVSTDFQVSPLLHESSDHSKLATSNSNVLGTLPSFIKCESPNGSLLFTTSANVTPNAFPVYNTVNVPVSTCTSHLLGITSTNVDNTYRSIPVTRSNLGYLLTHANPLVTGTYQPKLPSTASFTSRFDSVHSSQVHSSATPTKTETTTNIPSLSQKPSSSCDQSVSHMAPKLLSLLSSSNAPTSICSTTLHPSLPVCQISSSHLDHSKPANISSEADVNKATHSDSESPCCEPILCLPLESDIKNGEEDELVLFSHRANLYRFHRNHWKERGVGEMKILKHKMTGKVRLIMRRDQVLKLCCNHYITCDTSLKVMGPTQLAWYTNCDFSDGVSKPEKFAIKFKHAETSNHFKQVIRECVLALDTSNLADESPLSLGYAELDHSTVSSNSSVNSESSVLSEKNVFLSKSFSVKQTGTMSSILNSAWTCNTCLVQNEATRIQCVACKSSYSNQKESPPLVMSQLPLPHGWVCSECLVHNTAHDTQCVACGTTKAVPSNLSMLTLHPGVWTCGTCLVQNNSKDLLCVACKTQSSTKRELIDEDAEKASSCVSDTWDCKFCSTSNVFSLNRCIKCSSLRPSSQMTAHSNVSIAPGLSGWFPLDQEFVTVPLRPDGGVQVSTIKPNISNVSVSQSKTEGNSSPSTGDEAHSYIITAMSHFPKSVTVQGEQDEDILFCDSVSLLRFDDSTSTWKDQGIGDIQILKNTVAGKHRLLMRQDQDFKTCCNRSITAEMTITPMPSSHTAWILYIPCDFAGEKDKHEKFAVKFKNQNSAEVFKKKFDTCVDHCNNTSTSIKENQEKVFEIPTVSTLEGKSDFSTEVDDIIFVKAEKPTKDKIELARRLLLPDNFFNYENKLPCPGCRGCIDPDGNKHSDNNDQRMFQNETVNLSREGMKVSSNQRIFGNTDIQDKPFINFADLASSQATSSSFLRRSSNEPLSYSFNQAGAALFSSSHKVEVSDIEAEQDIQFKALVSLPKVEVITGEESEEILFSHRGKLYRFDETVNQWKERGIGDVKLLCNLNTNKTRILMRRDQILKVCCNHFITTDMKLFAYQERSWIWYAPNDFADEVPRPEKFAIKFKSAAIAEKFKVVFEDCVSKDVSPSSTKTVKLQKVMAPTPDSWSCNICCVVNPESINFCLACQAPKPEQISPISTCNREAIHIDDDSHELKEASREGVSDNLQLGTNKDDVKYYDQDVFFTYEEVPDADLVKKAEELLLPRSFYLYKLKPPCAGCRGCVDEDNTIHISSNDPAMSTLQAIPEASSSDDHKVLNEDVFSSSGMLSFGDLIKQENGSLPKKKSCFQFEGAGKQIFSSKEENLSPEAEADIVFQPVVSLPQTYLTKSWDEDTDVLFCHRAKLFRFDGSTNQWKERGIGDMKIVQHRQTMKIRLIMRRDQIFKLCCNHYLTKDMKLEQLQSYRSWMWFTPSDLSGDMPQAERLAVKFKHDESGLEFKRKFDECILKCEPLSKQLHDPVSTADDTNLNEMLVPVNKSWVCEECLIDNKISEIKCAACGSSKPFIKSQDDIKCVTVVKKMVSVPQCSEKLCTELRENGSTSGIKTSLLQEDPQTTRDALQFSSLESVDSKKLIVDTDSDLFTHGGGVEIPQQNLSSLDAPSLSLSSECHSLDLDQGATDSDRLITDDGTRFNN